MKPSSQSRLWRSLAPCLALSLALTGCGTTFKTHPAEPGADGTLPEGVPYALPMTLVQIDAGVASTNGKAVLSLTAQTQFVGDPEHQYVLEHVGSAAHDDLLTIDVGAHGLLDTVNADLDTQVLAAAEALATFVTTLGSLGSLGGGGGGVAAADNEPGQQLDDLDFVVDAQIALLTQELLQELGTRSFRLPIPDHDLSEFVELNEQSEGLFDEDSAWSVYWRLRSIDALPMDPSGSGWAGLPVEALGAPSEDWEAVFVSQGDSDGDAASSSADSSFEGVLTRVPEAYVLDARMERDPAVRRFQIPNSILGGSRTTARVRALHRVISKAAAQGYFVREVEDESSAGMSFEISARPQLQVSAVVIAPDRGPIVRVPVERIAFGNADYKFDFTSGMLVQATIDRDNSILNIVKVPAKIAEAIIALPAALVQFKIDQTKDEEALLLALQSLEDKVEQGQDSGVTEAQLTKAATDLVAALQAKLEFEDTEGEDAAKILTDWGVYLTSAITANASAEDAELEPPFDIEAIRALQP